MAYRVEFTEKARRQFGKLGTVEQTQVQIEIDKVEKLTNPRDRGEPLVGPTRLWRYRAGDIRIICEIIDEILVITAVKIEQRGSVYKR